MAIKELRQKGLTWVNIDTVDAEALEYLKKNHTFHPLDFEDIQGESQTPKIDAYKNYLFIILQFPHWQGEAKVILPYDIDIFIGEGYLITVQHSRSKEMKDFFYRCMKNSKVKEDWMSGSSGYLLYRLIEAIFREMQPAINATGREISQVENEIFEGEQDPKIVKRLAGYRRNILQFRRILDPQRYLISTLSHTRRSFLEEPLAIYFDSILDDLNKSWAIIESYHDIVKGLHITVESLITHRTNKIISALTAISVALLPLNLLSGIYGMNIAGLPFAHNPVWVWTMFGVLTLCILCIIFIMRRSKWI